jgi:hypothetical protein
MRQAIANFRAHLRDPILVDRGVDLLSAMLWGVYMFWGLTSLLLGLATISETLDEVYNNIWGISIAVSAGAALAGAIATLRPKRSIPRRIRWKQVEIWGVCVLAGFISVYPLFIAGQVFSGSYERIPTLFLATSYLLFPTWRVRHLSGRIRTLRGAVE